MVDARTRHDIRVGAREMAIDFAPFRLLQTLLMFGSSGIVLYDLWLMAPFISGVLH
jgi:hypothetical protein